jgi:hypothetical protein
MILAWLTGNYKGVVLFVLIASVAGYVVFLRADVRKHEAETVALKADIATLKSNLEATQNAVKAMDEGMRNFQTFVNQALESVKVTQRKISDQNKVLQRALDNIAVLAATAMRILDAPIIPFFMATDNAAGGTVLLGVDNGVHYFRVLPSVSPSR